LTNEEIENLFNHVCSNKHNSLTPAFDKNIDITTHPNICCEYHDQSSIVMFIEYKMERDLFLYIAMWKA